MTYAAATYGGSTLGGTPNVDTDVTSRATERELERIITVETRELML